MGTICLRKESDLFNIYQMLYRKLGPQHWWPGDTPFEVVVGAILTQNTAWTNVEKAIGNIKKEASLSFEAMRKVSSHKIARWIRPSGYFNLKAKRLKAFLNWLYQRCGGRLEELKKEKTADLRKELLEVYGIGPETADSILLYALGRKSFVVDAYTKRIFSRHGFIHENALYEDVKSIFESALPKSLKIYNELHALIVNVGKNFCRKKPLCHLCPLEKDLLKIKNQKPKIKMTM
ncbi:MAG: endonuclease III domain-containing protein [Chlamydiae bacterium]|nr:endonuclease III domain-containing protein [Chlamydiota bacterium]MBI3277855.1 endonuclease III domain-containing protein [Chlamydiota bacterium]